MGFHRSLRLITLLVLIFLLLFGAALYLMPLDLLSVQEKPIQHSPQIHEYYIIIDEATGSDLMYVPLVVSVGDEVITENNQRYKIVSVKENRAYARFTENVQSP